MSLRNHDWGDIVKVLTNHFGFRVDRQKGDHDMLIHDQSRRYTTVPRHNPVKERTLKTIHFQTALEPEEFLKFV
ncbi:MAG: hypothetical protein DLM72_17115 [Candidatus Nitrosopolaris wilkensis]|nr:MAG: hypothetical protein DLM72_17115 [Candidatus Nitrosopolaris wilkensis]